MWFGGYLSFNDFTFFVLFKWEYLVSLNLRGQPPPFPVKKADYKRLKKVEEVLKNYFYGSLSYPDLPELLLEVPPFTKKCLETLRLIPRGEVRTYKWLAHKIGAPRAFRAVGQALARNPLPLFFPCHRIIGQKDLGGFSAGLEWKKRLLLLEGVYKLKK